ncbi:RelA/SpoT family protein [Desulfotalea psychrophila]|uniref:Probable GTP pyrophosphokinase n=1 Tax=Desulfotalea psychrophila (strain LSv54 / DSM 12343) TaxID=177439 RepID=Q6ALZ1_DESPS|nr:HD domain-containing protein [Desulfotalea psychrophila]CAG36634.1 probable GTP pyrophosphokinase [Desulfotalea psychrophila LSv54]
MRHILFDLEIYRAQMQRILGVKEENDVFWRALDFAVDAHDDQWRKSGDAYILHPCYVAKILAGEMDITHPEILAAALLHDTIEDVEEVTAEVVGELFGSYVQAIVEGCTKVTHVSDNKQLNSKRTHRKIFSGAALRPEVMLVKLADRLHNLRTLQAMPKRKRQRIADETLDIYAPLATVFGLFCMKREMYNLALLYKFPKQGVKLKGYVRNIGNEPIVTKIAEALRESASELDLDCDVNIRIKDLWAYYDTNSHILLKQIDTPVEILILVDEPSSCYHALGVVNQTFPPIPRTIRDFISNPKPTGYQGLHARTIIEGRKYLVKIRTKEMALQGQRGIFRDWSSKTGKQGKFVQEIQEMFDIIGTDDSFSYRDVIAASGKKEVYTYTPNGDLICLPVNSTVLDFAFRVHTHIGLSCLGALIRSEKVGPAHVLRDGDMVRVIHSDEPIRFEQENLAACKTPRARSELAKGFRARRRKVTTIVGATILRQEMLRYGLPIDLLTSPNIDICLKRFSIDCLDDLHALIGEGRLHLHTIISAIKEDLFDGISPLVDPTGAFNSIEITTLDPVSVKLSSCCKPNPTAKDNFALLTPHGLSVHHKRCKTLEKLNFRRDDAVNITWRTRQTNVRKPQIISIPRASSAEVMSALSNAPIFMKIHEVKLVSVRHEVPEPAWQITFKVENLFELHRVQRYLQKTSLIYQSVFKV